MLVLGVDPGSLRTGWGAIESDGQRHRLLEMGVLKPPARAALETRLLFVHEGLIALIARLQPQALAVEDIFHAANSRSALILGHVRGAVLLAGARAGLPVSALVRSASPRWPGASRRVRSCSPRAYTCADAFRGIGPGAPAPAHR